MASPLTLPIARLRAAGCRVHHVLGHDPITTGSHPSATSRWQYGIVLPEGHRAEGKRVEDLLWSWDHDWSAMLGEASAYTFRDGRILVSAFARPDSEPKKPGQIRASRREVERDLSVLLDRIATVLS